MAHPFTTVLLDWFRENRRPLPWRETRDPYAIWLSEVILQQTRIAQGTAYWQRFVERWPTVEALAAATEDEVLREWQGLGYYSRARNLHAAAQQIVERGSFPDTTEEIRRLKGVGDYTAAAIASIAFDLPEAVVDGNVYRVLSRHFGIDTPINSTEGKKVFKALAQELLPTGEASAFNQAMMDFGAVQCTPQSPRCLLCPLAETCVARREGRVEALPVKLKTLKITTRHLNYIYIRCNGHTAIHRRGAGDIWQGLWEPPCPLNDDLLKNARPLRSNIKHVLTHRILLADFYLLECAERPPLPADFIWIPEADIEQYGVPRLVELLLEAVAKYDEKKI
ncbi:MAG: A/G-specific adenine glycosylase [Prevotella sp.]|nr:A/G-specific adenine glycosylase [Prevotella sp.]